MAGPEEVRAEKRRAMGPELGELHFHLSNELADLWIHWKDLLYLFGTEAARVALLNEAAGAFFGRTEYLMWSETLLHICRISDAAETFAKSKNPKPNLSVRALPTFIDDEIVRQEVELFVARVVDTTEFARDWRNRRLAHHERPPLNGTPPTPLALANRDLVDDALNALGDVLNLVAVRHDYATQSYDSSGELGRSVRHLVNYLEQGLALEHERRARRQAERATAEAQEAARQREQGASESAAT